MGIREFFQGQRIEGASADYRDWLQIQTCRGCGAAYRARKPGEAWVTEFQCEACAQITPLPLSTAVRFGEKGNPGPTITKEGS